MTPNKKKRGRVLFWVLSIFILILGLSYMPSITGILFLAASVLILPIGRLQSGLSNFFKNKYLKGGLCWLLIIIAFIAAPSANKTTGNEPVIDSTTIVEEQNKETEHQEHTTETEEPIQTPGDTKKPVEEVPAADEQQENPIIPTEEPQVPENSIFEIHYIDVGQADAALVLCDSKSMLIDGGNVADSSLIYSYLKKHSVSHLDYMIATHAHEDHVGGLAGALNFATVDTVYCPVKSYDSESFRDFLKYLNKQETEITVPKAGDSFKLGSAAIQVLGVNSASDTNNSSIVLRIVYGDTSFLFTGDAERDAEQVILNSGYNLESTVLKVGHHGSDSSSGYHFLREIAPKYAIISVGTGNSYGHPNEDTLSRLRDADVKVFRTDLQGTIICASDGKEVSFTVSKNADADTLAPQKTTKTEKPTTETTTPVITPPTNDETEENRVECDYIGNKNTQKFHYTYCSSVKKMKESNKYYYTGTRDEMISKGYTPCANCNP